MGRWLIVLWLAGWATGVTAQSDIPLVPEPKAIDFKPEVPLPTFAGGPISAATFAEYIRAVFVAFVWIVGILAVVMVVYGGVKWVAAAGNPGRITDARETVNSAIIGLIIALVSVVLLNLISPRLTQFPGLTLLSVKGTPLEFDNVVGIHGEGQAGQACNLHTDKSCQLFNVTMSWPVSNVTERGISSPIGPRRVVGAASASSCHPGTDFKTDRQTGKEVRAMHSGTIRLDPRRPCNEAALFVDGDGFSTRYVHISSVAVREGQKVRPGDLIGYSGGDPKVAGNCSSAPHLHVELYILNRLADVAACID
ncbi:MAG: peptidoglycan DD-metalloendopeptidase family protein [Candidatus Kerfeldbacteria bacterium]|nr:peptidoglycan DD-metalloendopeptidase family protein [Candidatus Kerfeldbacteria bacterium]